MGKKTGGKPGRGGTWQGQFRIGGCFLEAVKFGPNLVQPRRSTHRL